MSNGAAWSAERLTRLHRAMAGHVESGAVPGVVTLVSRRVLRSVDGPLDDTGRRIGRSRCC